MKIQCFTEGVRVAQDNMPRAILRLTADRKTSREVPMGSAVIRFRSKFCIYSSEAMDQLSYWDMGSVGGMAK